MSKKRSSTSRTRSSVLDLVLEVLGVEDAVLDVVEVLDILNDVLGPRFFALTRTYGASPAAYLLTQPST